MIHGEKPLTLAEVAQFLRISKSKLYQERKAGKLRIIRFGRAVRIRERDLQRYVQGATK